MSNVVNASVHSLPFADNTFDLVMGSPPYENARAYSTLRFRLEGNEFVEWCVDGFLECLRVCKGFVVWVINGRTRNYVWSGSPIMLMARLMECGVMLRKPPIYHRVGIPGSGGPDYWRDDYEFCIVGYKPTIDSKGRRVGYRLPWSDNTANGSAYKYKHSDTAILTNYQRSATDNRVLQFFRVGEKANAGNVIKCITGGGHMGSKLSHENEACYPESLVKPFVQCFCKPGGLVLDPFSGSGTTIAVATKLGRRGVGCDLRMSQCELSLRRMEEVRQSTIEVK